MARLFVSAKPGEIPGMVTVRVSRGEGEPSAAALVIELEIALTEGGMVILGRSAPSGEIGTDAAGAVYWRFPDGASLGAIPAPTAGGRVN